LIEERLFELIEPVLREGGAVREPGEEFGQPALDVLRYDVRPVRWSRVPFVGKGLSVVAVLRQPVDLEFAETPCRTLLTRLAMAASGRFPPWRGSVIGLTAIVLTPEPIGIGDEAVLKQVLDTNLRRYRVVPFGLFRVNLGQEAVSFALRTSPDRLFTEPDRLADTLSEHFKRFVPLLEL
jgi:hypothetical protein